MTTPVDYRNLSPHRVAVAVALVLGLLIGGLAARPRSPYEAKVTADQMRADEDARHYQAIHGKEKM